MIKNILELIEKEQAALLRLKKIYSKDGLENLKSMVEKDYHRLDCAKILIGSAGKN